MRKFYMLAVLLSVVYTKGQNIVFADPDFKYKLVSSNTTNNIVARDIDNNIIIVDADGNGEISQAEAQAVYHMYIINAPNIEDLSGLEWNTLRMLTIYCCVTLE